MSLTTKLFPYQEADVARAVRRGSMLVAYAMGLGKTIMSIAILEELFAAGKISRAVIVVPANLKWQWASAIAENCDYPTEKFNGITRPTQEYCEVISGPAQKRMKQYNQLSNRTPRYIIVTYDTVVSDLPNIKGLNPDAIILDESTYIKSFRAKRTKAIKCFGARYRFALSGQPVESRPEELFSMMQWVDAGVLGGYSAFDQRYIVRDFFGGVKRYVNLDELHTRMSDAMVRKTRRDPDVAPYLPDVQEEDILIPLDHAGKVLYKRIVKDFLTEIKKPGAQMAFDEHAHYHGGSDESGGGRAVACYAALLALCSHPDILVKSAQDYEHSRALCSHPDILVKSTQDYERSRALRAAGDTRDLPGSRYAYDLWQSGALDAAVKCPKLTAAVEEINVILDTHPDNKVILFSKYRWVIEELRWRLFKDALKVVYHGEMSSTEKALAVHKFRTDPATRIFLSTEAGTYGVDLPEATHLINYDPPPNAGRRGQRNARHVRAGSKHEKVFVLNLLVDESVEVRKLMVTELREELARAIMDGSGERVLNDIPSVTEWVATHTV